MNHLKKFESFQSREVQDILNIARDEGLMISNYYDEDLDEEIIHIHRRYRHGIKHEYIIIDDHKFYDILVDIINRLKNADVYRSHNLYLSSNFSPFGTRKHRRTIDRYSPDNGDEKERISHIDIRITSES